MGDAAMPDIGTMTIDMGVDPMDMMIALPTLQASPAAYEIPLLGAGERAIRTVTLTNASDVDALVTEFTLNITDGSAVLVYGSRQIIGIDPNGNDTFPYPVMVGKGEALELTVEYTLGDGEPGGEVTVQGNFEGEQISIPIRGLSSVGQIQAEPANLDFGRIREGTEATSSIVIRNTGEATLNISDIQKDLNVYFHLSIGDADPIEDNSSYADPDGDGSAGLSPGTSFTIDVKFAPTRESIEQSVIIIDTDDPTTPELRIPLIANGQPGCIEVSHEVLAWSGPVQMWSPSPEVTVTNCGDGPLYIDRIGLTPGSADAFEFQGMDLPMFPSELQAGAAPLTFSVNYGPPDARRYRGNIEILSNDQARSTIVIPLQAESTCASDDDCAMGYTCQDTRCIEVMMME
jgi:hypothetical protein